MSFLEKMQKRYTAKKYDANYQIPNEIINQLKEILALTPSSINSQPWHFTFISDAPTKQLLSKHSFHNTEKVADCSHLLVMQVIDHLDTFENQLFERKSHMLDYFKSLRKNLGEDFTKKWLSNQIYIALGVVLSACADMGIDSTAMEGIDTEFYTQQVGKHQYKVVLAVALGKHHPEDINHPSKTPKSRLPLEKICSEI
ncbi:nitroreductase family protein [Capnocytophaga canimorsus]|uniref:Oxygen-insensitive NAD(P)H nitroreductase n=2 Tax=Capnocytophaga canimorsus TaxID=28188 RepID=F9YRY5_CAPCC|nr:nitroreductase family protein [Capnocytophaga canimorsus]AEK23786.1 Oxygen-insensitive NAD(P)H nitroreductase [Capnocytophaga canimorsus Cc5]ATA91383.1 NAD(P)H-dependent oxidoreductase [Capnocytophaga canimorsus]ATA93542.1 NAD(P)H-dependent oxidoreductase [Capnocytophaga canimorsus]VEJ18855.1 Major NAD(P)H-flavin oxidoreductase [Capnocytophaga canimorsus]